MPREQNLRLAGIILLVAKELLNRHKCLEMFFNLELYGCHCAEYLRRKGIISWEDSNTFERWIMNKIHPNVSLSAYLNNRNQPYDVEYRIQWYLDQAEELINAT